MSMFDKQSIEAYRNIKAPEELREKVMRLNPELSSPGSNHRSKNAMLRPIAAGLRGGYLPSGFIFLLESKGCCAFVSRGTC